MRVCSGEFPLLLLALCAIPFPETHHIDVEVNSPRLERIASIPSRTGFRRSCSRSPGWIEFANSTELLQVTLCDQSPDVPLPDIELAVLGQGDCTVDELACELSGETLVWMNPYSVWISPASLSTRTSMKRSLGGSKLPVRSMSVHWPL